MKGTLLMTQGFIRLAEGRTRTIVNVSSFIALSVVSTTASYALSKLAFIQIQQFVTAENPNIVCYPAPFDPLRTVEH